MFQPWVGVMYLMLIRMCVPLLAQYSPLGRWQQQSIVVFKYCSSGVSLVGFVECACARTARVCVCLMRVFLCNLSSFYFLFWKSRFLFCRISSIFANLAYTLTRLRLHITSCILHAHILGIASMPYDSTVRQTESSYLIASSAPPQSQSLWYTKHNDNNNIHSSSSKRVFLMKEKTDFHSMKIVSSRLSAYKSTFVAQTKT